MADADMVPVLEIERLSYPHPWGKAQFERELTKKWSFIDLVVCEDQEDPCAPSLPVAHVVYWIVCDELHILNIAVYPEYRVQGHSKRLMSHLIELSSKRALCQIALEVRVSNVAALGLYRGFGFEEIGYRKKYYADNQEDALVMALKFEHKNHDGPGAVC